MDFKKLGFTRDALVKALKAEGVDVNFWDYPEQHKLKNYSEAKQERYRRELQGKNWRLVADERAEYNTL